MVSPTAKNRGRKATSVFSTHPRKSPSFSDVYNVSCSEWFVKENNKLFLFFLYKRLKARIYRMNRKQALPCMLVQGAIDHSYVKFFEKSSVSK